MNLAIIQARMASKRLQGKVMLELQGLPVIHHIYNRVKKAEGIDKVVVAVGDGPKNLKLIDYLKKVNIEYLVGSETDVLSRFIKSIVIYNPDNILRITADCPVICPEIIEGILYNHIKGRFDYSSNVCPPTFPDGLDAEVFTKDILIESHNNVSTGYEREHVTPWIRTNAKNIYNFESGVNNSHIRMTLDNEDDWKFMKQLYHWLYAKKPDFNYDDILDCLKKHPDLLLINQNWGRNYGSL